MSETLPIFPLNTVLFPGAPLPLRIFEPRYREMLKRCLDGDRRFGVVLIKSGAEVGGIAEPHDVGTVARIERVREEDKGSIPVSTRGEGRFRILSLDRSGDYLVGDIEFLSDEVDAAAGPAADVARKAADEYIRLLLTVGDEIRTRDHLLGRQPLFEPLFRAHLNLNTWENRPDQGPVISP